MSDGPFQNTDHELWRERPGDYYADSIHVTESGAIGINCGGFVIVKPVRGWHALAMSVEPRAPGEAMTDPERALREALVRVANLLDAIRTEVQTDHEHALVNGMTFQWLREKIPGALDEATAALARAEGEPQDDERCRHWALANVRRYEAKPLPCGHGRDGASLEYATCVGCAWEMGRREGHVEAGAYLTHQEAMAEVRSRIKAAPAPYACPEGPSA